MSGEKSRFGFGDESEMFFEIRNEFVDECIADGAVVFGIDVEVVSERAVGIEMNVYDVLVEAIGIPASAPGAAVAPAEPGDVVYGGVQSIGFFLIGRGKYDTGPEIERSIVKCAQHRTFEFNEFDVLGTGDGRWLEAFGEMNDESAVAVAVVVAVFDSSRKGDRLRIAVEVLVGESKAGGVLINIEDGDDFKFTLEVAERFGESFS